MSQVNPVSVTATMDTIDLRNAQSTPVTAPDHVDTLQALLKVAAKNNPAFDPGAIDGIGGPKTKQATGNFQNAKTGTVDYVVNSYVWGTLIGDRP